jgi:alkylation response protein AidB-like acyl-CoA dehydrogenase
MGHHMAEEIIDKIIDECRKFAVNEIRKTSLGADLSSDTDWVLRVWEKSGQLGLPFLPIPEDFQGAACSSLECALVLDLLAEECAGIASVYAHHFTACITLLMADDNHQKRLFSDHTDKKGLPGIFSVIFPEESGGNNLWWVKNNDHLIIKGTSPITGGILLSDGFMMFLTDAGDSEKSYCVWVDRSAKGVTTGEPLQLPGLKVTTFGKLHFDDAVIANEHIIAHGQTAQKMLSAAQSVFYGFIGALAIGAARRAFQKAMEYAKERYQFGKQIIQHQEIQRMLGNMHVNINAGTAAYRQAFGDQKLKFSFFAPDAISAKIFCTNAAIEIALDAIQIHGGYGYMHEYGIEKIMRDVKVLQLLGGTNPLLEVHHIADNM